MPRLFRLSLLALTLLAGLAAAPCRAASLAATPFYTVNQSPVIQIFGLPAPESATVQAPGKLWGLAAFDIASNYALDSNRRERILLDGESYRTTLTLRYGVAPGLEAGLDLPLVGYSGGILDGLIEGWHNFFHLPQGGRPDAPRDRLLFSYQKDNQELLHRDSDSYGLGDLRLSGAWQLYRGGNTHQRALALRASLKLPTGSSSRLHGSGSTDFALWLTGCDDYQFSDSQMHLALFGAAGALALTDGRVLEHQQKNLVGFGTVGLGWAPTDWIAFKTQLALNTPFYGNSDLRELGQSAVQLIFGGALGFSARTALDIGVSEDVSVNTSPDLAVHLGLSHQF
jgi:hypothetical protein